MPYTLLAVEKIDTPDGLEGDNWYHYVISRRNSAIEGFRSGSLKEVTRHAEQYTKDLNSRLKIGYSAYISRKKPASDSNK